MLLFSEKPELVSLSLAKMFLISHSLAEIGEAMLKLELNMKIPLHKLFPV